jgi:hypothetical protein
MNFAGNRYTGFREDLDTAHKFTVRALILTTVLGENQRGSCECDKREQEFAFHISYLGRWRAAGIIALSYSFLELIINAINADATPRTTIAPPNFSMFDNAVSRLIMSKITIKPSTAAMMTTKNAQIIAIFFIVRP